MERQQHKATGKLRAVSCPGGINCVYSDHRASKRTLKRIWNRTVRRMAVREIAAEVADNG